MTASIKQAYESYQSTALSTDRPCDTGQFWTVTDNVLHMCDSAPCYRVNWVSPPFSTTRGAYPAIGLAIPFVFSGPQTIYAAAVNLVHEFPITMLYSGKFPRYDVRVAAATSSGTMSVTATMASVAAATGTGIEDENVLGVLSGTTSSTSGAWCVDGRIDSRVRNASVVSRNTFTTRPPPNTGNLPGASVFARLQIVGISIGLADALAYCTIVGVQVREYTDR